MMLRPNLGTPTAPRRRSRPGRRALLGQLWTGHRVAVPGKGPSQVAPSPESRHLDVSLHLAPILPGRLAISLNIACFLPRRLKSLNDGFHKLLGRRDGTHVDNELIDHAIFVEVHLIDRLKLLALDLALKSKEVPIVPSVSG